MTTTLFLRRYARPRSPLAALAAAALLLACGGSDGEDALAGAPPDQGFTDTSPAPAVAAPFVAHYKTNTTANSTPAVNAVLALLSGMDALWQPGTAWNNGTVRNAAVLQANVRYVADLTAARTPEQESAAYLDDRRNQNYGVLDGFGPLTDVVKTGLQSSTSINGVPADAATVKYDDTGSWGSTAAPLGQVATLVGLLRGASSSTTPAKNFYAYPRPWRLDANSTVVDTGTLDGLGFPVYATAVQVAPSLLPVRSTTPATDGGFTSGHTNASYLAALSFAYAMPERFQELLTRASELGHHRIMAGMHSPLDVMGGRVMATALAAAILNDPANATAKTAAVEQAHAYVQAQTGATADNLFDVAHAAPLATDRFADRDANLARYTQRMSYGFAPVAATTAPVVVPQGAEVLLETRLPYLSAEQRRVVLRSTGIASGYPLLDDAEGWGRLNLVGAADGYAEFRGDVVVTMDAARGGFHAADRWRNNISGSGKLGKRGSGRLTLSGNNRYTGGTVLQGGTLVAASATAFGTGEVYVSAGTLSNQAATALVLAGGYTQRAGSTLLLRIGNAGQGRMDVAGSLVLAGGHLQVELADGYVPSKGDTLSLVNAARRSGVFDSVTVPGRRVTPVYTDTAVLLRFDS